MTPEEELAALREQLAIAWAISAATAPITRLLPPLPARRTRARSTPASRALRGRLRALSRAIARRRIKCPPSALPCRTTGTADDPRRRTRRAAGAARDRMGDISRNSADNASAAAIARAQNQGALYTGLAGAAGQVAGALSSYRPQTYQMPAFGAPVPHYGYG